MESQRGPRFPRNMAGSLHTVQTPKKEHRNYKYRKYMEIYGNIISHEWNILKYILSLWVTKICCRCWVDRFSAATLAWKRLGWKQLAVHWKKMLREVWQSFQSDLSSEIGRKLWKIIFKDYSRSMIHSDIRPTPHTLVKQQYSIWKCSKYIFQELRYCTSYATKYCSTWYTSNIYDICWVAKLKHLQINRQANYKIY